MNILFINGVNTAFGGSGKNALGSWLVSLSGEGFHISILNTVPTFGIKERGVFLKILLLIFFFPGSLFRFIKNPLAELFYKLSPFLFSYIIFKLLIKKYKYIVFSHYCIFLYYFIFKRDKRVFIVQDLLYLRAKSQNYPHNFCKIIFKFEVFLYSKAPNIICLSHDEKRILVKFLKSNISLATCLNEKSFNNSMAFKEVPNRIAVVSDWRRDENLHGLIKFFNSTRAINQANIKDMEFWIYGISSGKAIDSIEMNPFLKQFKFYDGGLFETYNDIPTKYFLVPIYQGAGIKLKTLEMFSNGRFVFGTPGAFAGIPRRPIKKYSMTVYSAQDIFINSSKSPYEINSDFKCLHDSTFIPMGKIFKNF